MTDDRLLLALSLILAVGGAALAVLVSSDPEIAWRAPYYIAASLVGWVGTLIACR